MIRNLGIFQKTAGIFVLASLLLAQDHPVFKVKVDMVVLSFQVTDNKGKYINGLKPKDFRVLEDGIPQKFVTFAEGSKPPVEVAADGSLKPIPISEAGIAEGRSDAFVGTNVFVLFDTSNYMYRGFVYASDAIADFIRGLDRAGFRRRLYLQPQSVARRNAHQGARRCHLRPAQSRRRRRFRALQRSFAHRARRREGARPQSDHRLYSNGPDNASMVAPSDVSAVARGQKSISPSTSSPPMK